MFSYVSVHHSVHRGVPMWPLPMMHWTSLYSPSPSPGSTPPPDMGHGGPLNHSRHEHGDPSGPPPLLVTSGGHHCRPVQICSLDLTIQGPHSYWLLVATKAHTVSKRAECILLECFLVYQCCLLFPILSHCFSLFLQSCSNLYKCKKINCAQEPFGLLLASQTVGLKVELSGINSAVEKSDSFS